MECQEAEEEVERFQARLNTLGADNWEMISYEWVPLTGDLHQHIKGHANLTFFKRSDG